ncbi:substrate-binding domain-containing protein [Microbacterium sp. LRZ72]|uniref:sugar ABC transporter substrate-binding protein n=1 Tax=Microbacterium sp. LRZ72 TaxID=2942481 RepID=UPI0029AF7EE7|nr:substrate-binding domain-containing protein [Microbacterium sp. LRZ72]MDX2376806.1 substrate-binding domain-containing protein [Microbacterium sp. LRZ72]
MSMLVLREHRRSGNRMFIVEGRKMKKSLLLPALAAVGASAVLLAGCSGSSTPSSTDGGGEATGRACVILPDAASSPRWENFDRKYLQEGLEEAGFEVDIQNAQGDVAKYSTIADQQLTQGCGVMLLVDYQGAAEAVAEKASAEGIPVIAYDRPFTGADYYVSFDNMEVGRMQGQTVLNGLEAEGKDPAEATVVYVGGDPTDGNAAMFHDGADEVLAEAGVVPAAEPPGAWDQAKSQTNFEQALTSLDGEVDGVWVANDTNAAGVIKVLQDNNLAGVAVSGQDANVAGLQNILLGWQTATVYKPVKDEATAAVDVAVALLNGEDVETDAALDDGTPYIQVTPILVGPNEVADVIAAGDAAYDDVCTPDVMEACEEFGVTAP